MSEELDEAMAEVRAAVDHLERALEQLDDATLTEIRVGDDTDRICVGDVVDVTCAVNFDHEFVNEAQSLERSLREHNF